MTFCGYGAEEALGPATLECKPRKLGATPFLSNPTECSQPLATLVSDPYPSNGTEPSTYATATAKLPNFTGCEALTKLFEPALAFEPSSAAEGGTTQAGAPSAMSFSLQQSAAKVNPTCTEPQAGEVICPPVAPALKKLSMTLPEGLSLSSSAAQGLAACQNSQFGLGSEFNEVQAQDGEVIGREALSEPAKEAACPNESQIGTAEVFTPELPREADGSAPLKGTLFVAQPECAPCSGAQAQAGELFRLFLQLTDKKAGLVIKLVGKTTPNLATGQLTTTFEDQPQISFEKLVVHLKGGPRAVLQNPKACSANEQTVAQLTPWSSETAHESSDHFASECPPDPFAPAFSAGTTYPAAGKYSPFSLTVARASEAEQNLEKLEVHMPPGLTAKIAGVPLCAEAQANAGSCEPASQIGTVTVGVGAGPHPFYEHGRVYLTGPYGGGPFGLSIVVPTTAGPFVLQGNTGRGEEVVRSAILINEKTAAVTVVSNGLPQLLDGVPLEISKLNVRVERPGQNFELNPTNCKPQPQGITATLGAPGGATPSPATQFDVGGCAALSFHPSFTASTQAKTSRTDGASFSVKVTQSPGEANIHKTDLQLPSALPSRLTTIQNACTEAQFAKEPGPAPNNPWSAGTRPHAAAQRPAHGPRLPGLARRRGLPRRRLRAPGPGRRLDLVGHTDIKGQITYSRFETVPDQPISSFETNLPEGPHSALTANGNLCTQMIADHDHRPERRRDQADADHRHRLPEDAHEPAEAQESARHLPQARPPPQAQAPGLRTQGAQALPRQGEQVIARTRAPKRSSRRNAKGSPDDPSSAPGGAAHAAAPRPALGPRDPRLATAARPSPTSTSCSKATASRPRPRRPHRNQELDHLLALRRTSPTSRSNPSK